MTSCNFLIIDSPTNTKDYKAHLAEVLFEDMKVNRIIILINLFLLLI